MKSCSPGYTLSSSRLFVKARKIAGRKSVTTGDPHPITEILTQVKGSVAYDVGANVGGVAKILSKNFEIVFAFEPAEESFSRLRDLNDDKIKSFNIAISDINGFISLDVRENQIDKGQLVTQGITGFNWGNIKGIRQVPALTLDSLFGSLPKADFVKIDTEGHELKILQGAKNAIENWKISFLVEIHDAKNGDAIADILRKSHNIQEIRHPGHSPSSENWLNHYFIIAKPR